MDFKQQLKEFKIEFDNRLEQFLEKKLLEAKKLNQTTLYNLEQIAFVLKSGGKRFRPALAYFGYKLAGGKDNQAIWDIALALELFHGFALIHDDIIDKSLVRRGVPTVEALYQEYFTKKYPNIDAKHFAMSAAILGGDLAFVLANQLIASLACDLDIKEQVQNIYYTMQFELVAGQEDDCFGVGLSDLDDLKESDVISMLKFKSGNYSIQKPLLIGALLANAALYKQNVIISAGEKLGLVFQIKDDILGIFGDEKAIGKSNTSDITEGKRTLMMLRSYNQASTDDKNRIKIILGNENADLNDINWLKSLIQNSGIVAELEEHCLKLVTEAKAELNQVFDSTNEALQFLLAMSDYLYARQS
jgi:geranylgeranyl diphosphate synthase type I